MKYEVSFDRTSKKFICPSCGKKRFVKYYNYTLKEYFPAEYGRCDREVKCGYELSLKQYFNKDAMDYVFKPIATVQKPPTYIDIKTVNSFSSNYKANNFIQFLKTVFPDEAIKKIITTYLLGTSNHWLGSTIFWQVDNENRLRSGKIILYDAITGKRVKKPYPHITWYHKKAKINNFNLEQCLFGLHLVKENSNLPISIVESEKTACIMSALMPESIWLATGSLNNINHKIFMPIFDRDIILYPDASIINGNGKNCFSLWNEKTSQLSNLGYKIIVSDLLEKKTTTKQKEAGYDLADFFIEQLKNKTNSIPTVAPEENIVSKLSTPQMRKLDYLLKKNPLLQKLIDTFGLELI